MKPMFWDFFNKVMYALLVALTVWVWQTNEKIVVLQTQFSETTKGTSEKIEKIEKTVDKIYDILIQEARRNP